MIHPAIPALLLILAVPAANAVPDRPGPGAGAQAGGVRITQMTIHERVIIRVPRVAMPVPAPVGRVALDMPMPVKWKEKKGPKCLAVAELAGAMVSRNGTIDIALTTGKRMRAVLREDCQPLDAYSGFYIRPGADGKVCADRDAIRARSGATCPIDTFKSLVASR
jgi:hypothetical protein